MGGMQRHSRLLAEHLARQGGFAITVLHPHTPPIFDPALGIREVAVAPIDPARFYLRELWRYSGRTAEALDALRPDVVLSQGFCVWKGIARFGPRLIVHPHGLEMFQNAGFRERLVHAPFRRVLRWVLRRSAVAVSLGGGLTPVIEGLVRGSACRVEVLPNAVDVPEEPVPYPASHGPLRLLFVGRFAFNKGIDVLMAVARRLCDEGRGADVIFELAGDGPLLRGYMAQGLPENVRLLGRVGDAELEACYAACHALVLPTRGEGMPTVVLEAMARARPVLVSDVGAAAGLLVAENGRLLPPGDADALYRAVVDLAAMDVGGRAAMGRRGHALARRAFSWPRVTEDFAKVMRRVGGG